MINKLPTVDGYTMDNRLQEFRKVDFGSEGPSMETVPFDSDKGRELLEKSKGDTTAICGRCGCNPNSTQDSEQQMWETNYIKENGLCSACVKELEENNQEDECGSWACCILCNKYYLLGDTGNELGFCVKCQEEPDFPFDLDKYYKDHDANKVAFKGFETMSRGLLENYRK